MASNHPTELDELETNNAALESEDDGGSDFDLETLILVTRKSLIWLLLLITLGLAGAFLVIRYTPKLYMSTSLLKIDEQSEAGALGLNTLPGVDNRANINKLSGEIELLKSNLIYERLQEEMDLGVNYYVRGKVLSQELYNNSPFNIIFKVKNESLYNQEIDLDVLNGNRFRLSYTKGEEVVSGEYSFNEIISNPDFDLKILKTESFSPDAAGQDYYFKINSTGAILSYL